MHASRIHPILLINLLTDTEDQLARLEPHLREVEEDSASAVAIQRSEECITLAEEDELQLESACHRLAESASARFGALRIAHRETIRRTAEAEGKYIRQAGGAGNYGHCWLRVEPNEPGEGNEFVNEISNGAIPSNFVGSIKEGVQSAMAAGILAGYPLTDVKTVLFDGSSHYTDSNEMAFQFAGSIALREAARKAAPILLEPVMAIEIAINEEHIGAIIADINARRGRIEQLDNLDGWCEIEAIVPLAELLRASPRGRPEYAMRFACYQEVPRRGDDDDGDFPVPSLHPRKPRPSGRAAGEPEPSA